MYRPLVRGEDKDQFQTLLDQIVSLVYPHIKNSKEFFFRAFSHFCKIFLCQVKSFQKVSVWRDERLVSGEKSCQQKTFDQNRQSTTAWVFLMTIDQFLKTKFGNQGRSEDFGSLCPLIILEPLDNILKKY